MKNPILRSAAVAAILYTLVIASSCGDRQSNTTANQNTAGNPNANAPSNQNSNANGGSSGVPLMNAACNNPDINQKLLDVRAAISGKFNGSNGNGDLYDQTHKVNGVDPNLKYDVEIAGADPNGYLILYLAGGVEANKGKSNKPFEDLAKYTDEFVAKGCIQKVLFLPPGTTLPPAPTASGDVQGFGWTSCDYPNVACAGGECLPSCNKKTK
ncbi:MAG TPA: hypothetical protein VGI80_07265 [Pyrinomonadaceae bacterium]|jgi:hypothetical protein